MNVGGLARRYVQPLFEVALEKGELEGIYNDVALLDRTLKESPDLWNFLANPSIGRQAKKTLVEKIFADCCIYTLNFLKVVIDKNRPEVLRAAYHIFTGMLNVHRGVIPGVVESAVPLDDADLSYIKRILESRFESRLELKQRVDPVLLGGVRVRIGNTVIDGSVKGRLERLKTALIGG